MILMVFVLPKLNENMDKIIIDFNLDLSSTLTRQFRDCLEILTKSVKSNFIKVTLY